MTIGCFGNRRFRKPGVTTGLPLSRLLVFLGFQARTISGFLTVRVSAATAYGFPDGREIKVAWELKRCFSIYTRAIIALLAVCVYSGRSRPGLQQSHVSADRRCALGKFDSSLRADVCYASPDSRRIFRAPSGNKENYEHVSMLTFATTDGLCRIFALASFFAVPACRFDVMTALAYYSIPGALIYFARAVETFADMFALRRLHSHCGTTHLLGHGRSGTRFMKSGLRQVVYRPDFDRCGLRAVATDPQAPQCPARVNWRRPNR